MSTFSDNNDKKHVCKCIKVRRPNIGFDNGTGDNDHKIVGKTN